MSELSPTDVLVVFDEYKSGAEALANEIRAYFQKLGTRVALLKGAKSRHAASKAPEEPRELGKTFDLAITIGGDGTTLHTCRLLAPMGSPILAVNMGRLGFFSEFLASEWREAVEAYLRGELRVVERTLIAFEVKRAGESVWGGLAQNEIVAGRVGSFNLVTLELLIGDESLGDIRADGLIVASPSGSTAYALAVGGPIMPPEAAAILVAPISPFSLSVRPLVLPAHHIVTLRVSRGQRSELSLTSDGQVGFPLMEDDEIIAKTAPYKTRLLSPQNRSFYEVMRYKLGWQGRFFDRDELR